MFRLILILISSLMLTSYALAQSGEDEAYADVPLPPDIPDPLEDGQIIEPEVTIIRTDEKVIEEYRLNGQIYMIKITPKIGKPYYLIDRDGDGTMEARTSEIYDDFLVPQWVLFSW